MSESKSFLKPCLVLGTGLHRWILGESMSGNTAPLYDWNSLILKVAEELQVPMSRSSHNLALHWETLISEMGREQNYKLTSTGKQRQAHAIELIAKKKAAEILRSFENRYPSESFRATTLREGDWGSFVSFNFESHWLPKDARQPFFAQDQTAKAKSANASGGTLTKAEHIRLTGSITGLGISKEPCRLWFPDGHIDQPISLRLGLREFGLQSNALNLAFKNLKIFERSVAKFHNLNNKHDAHHAVCSALFENRLKERTPKTSSRPEPPIPPLNWVAEILYRPVCFAGLGLSDSEVGLWWLLVQRSRNLMHTPIKNQPKAAILLRKDDSRRDFWQSKPCGIEPIICSTWDEGWEKVQGWAKSYNE